MGRVMTFEDYTPAPRTDGVPWTRVKIEESTDGLTGWSQIDIVAIDPVDADPSDPQTRSITTEFASETPDLWYRLIFLDAVGNNSSSTSPVQDVTDQLAPYLPSVAKVAELLRARTKDAQGNEIGTFNKDTRPNANQVLGIIRSAATDLVGEVDTDIPKESWETAETLIALQAAMRIELSYFPEQVEAGKSPYDKYEKLFEGGLERLKVSIQREAEEEESGEAPSTNDPVFNFPEQLGWDTVVM